jgi:hypothetical protein
MLILTATNATVGGLSNAEGFANYNVWVGINQHCIWRGEIRDHLRESGAAELIRRIAVAMEADSCGSGTAHNAEPTSLKPVSKTLYDVFVDSFGGNNARKADRKSRRKKV